MAEEYKSIMINNIIVSENLNRRYKNQSEYKKSKIPLFLEWNKIVIATTSNNLKSTSKQEKLNTLASQRGVHLSLGSRGGWSRSPAVFEAALCPLGNLFLGFRV